MRFFKILKSFFVSAHDVYEVPVYPNCFVPGISVYYDNKSVGFYSEDICLRFVPLALGSHVLRSLQLGSVIWVPQQVFPDRSGFTKWIISDIVYKPGKVQLYYNEGEYLVTINEESPDTAFVVFDEPSLLQLVKDTGSRAIGLKLS